MRVNPVLEREVRERPRSTSAVVMLTIYLAVLTGLFAAVYEIGRYSAGNSQVLATSVADIGQSQFEWVLLAMLLLVLFLVPGYTASAIAGERERQTLLPMQLTLLRPSRIVSGKASASVAFLALLIVASAPLLALAFAMGGVSLGQVLRGLVAVLFVGLVLALVTVACSTLVRRVAGATVLAYTATLVLLVGTIVVWGGTSAAVTATDPERRPYFAPVVLVAANPVMFVSSAIAEGEAIPNRFNNGPPSPLRSISDAMGPREQHVVQAVGPGGFVDQRPQAGEKVDPLGRFLWWSLGVQLALGGLCWWAASRRLRTPAEIER